MIGNVEKNLIRVVLVDDHVLIRQGIMSVLENEKSIKIIGEANNGREAIEIVNKLNPDVLLMDIVMPELNGHEATKIILNNNTRKIKIIALSAYIDMELVKKMILAGARGYVLKSSDTKEIVEAIRIVHSGFAYFSKEILSLILNHYNQLLLNDEICLQEVNLSSKEMEVLQLLAEGQSSREIAEKLHLSSKTIDSHRHNILKKLSIDNIPELTKWAIRKGITSVE